MIALILDFKLKNNPQDRASNVTTGFKTISIGLYEMSFWAE